MEIREYSNASSGFFYKVKEILASKQTQYQKAELVETEFFGKALLLDGRTQVTERWEYRYHEPLVHPAVLIHPNPKRALLIGGGDGGTLREIQKYKSIESVDFAELDPEVVTFSKEYFPTIHQNAFSDKRVTFHIGDGREFVFNAAKNVSDNPKKDARSSANGYDIIIMDMTDPVGPACMLYTKEFFLAVKKLFKNKNAVFSMHGESPMAWPEAFACISATLSDVFAHVSTSTCYVPMYGALWSYKYASDSRVPVLQDSGLIQDRITERFDKPLTFVNKEMWPSLFANDPVIAEADSHPLRRIIRDSDPVFPGIFDAQ
ncbi:MAG: polyamine aminopropyltransferase [Treponema sp.]|nr:polyamine aminopropyltransferase [Treponema sp.]